MANCSDASGTLFITASNQAECELVFALIEKITNHWYYEFACYDEPELEEVTVGETEKSDSTTMSVGFSATGRWTFQNNVQAFGKWLNNSDYHDGELEAIERLEKHAFTLHFEYDEDEPGCMFIGKGSATLVHKKDTRLADMELTEDEYESYDLTVENLVDIRGFDEDYAKSYLGEEEDD